MTAETAGEQPARPTETREVPTPLHRSRTDRVLAGVCGGIAETYGADPTAVRLLAAIIAIFTGVVPMLIIYLIAAVVVPESTGGEASADPGARARIEPGQAGMLFGMVLIVVGVVALANEIFSIDWELLWPAALIAFGGLVVLLAVRRGPV
jgi:phage shock protein C